MNVRGMNQSTQAKMRSKTISEIRFNLEGPRFRILCYSDPGLRYRYVNPDMGKGRRVKKGF
jgi:hypothetical protein